MSEPTDREIEEQTDKLLDAQIAEYEEEKRNPTPPDPDEPDPREARFMAPELIDHNVALAGLTEWTNAIRLMVVPEEDWALVANHLRTIEKDLAEKRREIESEATAVAQAARTAEPFGKKLVYESDRGALVEQTTRTRSFNTPGILAAIARGVDGTLLEAIQTAIEENALSLTWKISYLETIADRLGLDIPTTHHEIEDGDPDYLVGVVSTSKMGRG